MSDPLETLEHFAEGEAGPALPASEVRRRGDRMRRRRTALRVVGAACAVAVITTGGIALGSDRTGSSPQPPPVSRRTDPAPDPTRSAEARPVVTTIPDDFPLAEGYPPDTGSERELDGPGPDLPAPASGLQACGQSVYPTVRSEQRLGVRFTQPEDYRFRELTTYGDDAAAREALTNLVEGYRACSQESSGGTPESVTLSEVRQTGLGDEGHVVLQTYEVSGMPALGLNQVHAVRVGNALLLSGTANEASPDDDSVSASVRTEERALAPLIQAMCVFAGAGCGDP